MSPAIAHQSISSVHQRESRQAARCRKKFLKFFPKGFVDPTYLEWERDYKVHAHQQWSALLNRSRYAEMLKAGEFKQVVDHAVRIESRTNLLFSFEKMALRDAVRDQAGARLFAAGLYEWLHGSGLPDKRFEAWCEVVSELPRKQTRVLTWPIVTVFGFVANPKMHVFLKPQVTKIAAQAYGFDFLYRSRPGWDTYHSLLTFADIIRGDVRDLRPRDMIDLQSFIWVLGSDEYE